MLFGYSLTPFGHHPQAWKQLRDSRLLGFNALLDQAATAEAAGFDFVLLADRLGLRPLDDLSSVAVPFEPTLLASALASRNRRIGILAAASTAQHEPYNLARRIASLDLISKGRAGWMVLPSRDDPARESEYLDLVQALWDSFEDDAFLYDKAAGRFFDPSKMHVANHKGTHFSVRGPLNVNPSPQGRPVLAQFLDEGDNALSIRTGELLLLQAKTVESLIEIARGAAKSIDSAGSSQKGIRLLANIVPIVTESAGAASEASEALKFSDEDRVAQPLAGLRIVGTPGMIADQLQALATTASLDGFTILPPTLDMATRFFAGVVPEIERLGMVTTKSRGTFRDRLGLARPEHPSVSAKTVSQ